MNIHDKIEQRKQLANIRSKIDVPPRGGLVEADEEVITPLMRAFEERFSLVAGEYRMRVTAIAGDIHVQKDYDFTIFESDEQDLRELADDYKFGAWIYWERTDKEKYLRVPVRESP